MRSLLCVAAFDLTISDDPDGTGRQGAERALREVVDEVWLHDAGPDAAPVGGDDRAGGVLECGRIPVRLPLGRLRPRARHLDLHHVTKLHRLPHATLFRRLADPYRPGHLR